MKTFWAIVDHTTRIGAGVFGVLAAIIFICTMGYHFVAVTGGF